MLQTTLVLIKPDGVKRHLIGEIIWRFEKAGLIIKQLKMLVAPPEIVAKHYPDTEEYLVSIGKKSAAAGTEVTDYKAQGWKIVKALRDFISSGPVVAMVLEGDEAVPNVRKITGYTDPATAEKGTIRGDLGQDSIAQANAQGRPCYNLIHASGNPEEAEAEIKLWFGESSI